MNKVFLYSDLFILLPQTSKVSKVDFAVDGKTPVYSSDTTNNGCLGYVNREPLFCISDDRPVYLVFGDHTRTMNIVREDFCVTDNVKVLVPKMKMTDEMLLYISVVWKKAIPNQGYARHWKAAKEADIELPVIESSDAAHEYTVDDIDWQYMQDYIKKTEHDCVAELETRRSAEAEAYMKAAGIEDYGLTEKDRAVLAEKKTFVNFVLHDIFECLKVTTAQKSEVRGVRSDEFCVPVVYAKYGDNGIMYWGRKNEFTTYDNVISVVYNGAVSAGKVYAQEEPTGVLAESYLIRYKHGDVPFLANLYMAEVIEHKIYSEYSRENLAIWNDRVENEEIELPVTSDGSIDFDYMERYIKAVEKLVIADAVKHKDALIDITKQIVES